MYVYQNGKLYSQVEERLVGVEIYSDKVLLVEECTAELEADAILLTPFEVRCKFQIDITPYIFPREIKEEDEKEVEENEPIKPAKRTSRKSTGK